MCCKAHILSMRPQCLFPSIHESICMARGGSNSSIGDDGLFLWCSKWFRCISGENVAREHHTQIHGTDKPLSSSPSVPHHQPLRIFLHKFFSVTPVIIIQKKKKIFLKEKVKSLTQVNSCDFSAFWSRI